MDFAVMPCPICSSGRHDLRKPSETHTYLEGKYESGSTDTIGGEFCSRKRINGPQTCVPYFGNGDEFHMAFHFPLMPRLFMAMAVRIGIPSWTCSRTLLPFPKNCQWCLFLRNHDELTLGNVCR